jgi:hypothetical protein
MDFPQFVNMLETKSLYFRRLDLLDDPYEGSFSWLNIYNKDKDLKERLVQGKKHMGVNCWHCNREQSMGMWRLYARKQYGIAIKSTYDDLCKAITSPQDTYIGKVEYWQKPSNLNDIGLYSGGVLHKLPCYDYEKEVRAVVHNRSLFWDNPKLTMWDFQYEGKEGVDISVDLSVLIKKVYVCPDSRDWFYKLVKSIVKEKYNMNFQVCPSNLLTKPGF